MIGSFVYSHVKQGLRMMSTVEEEEQQRQRALLQLPRGQQQQQQQQQHMEILNCDVPQVKT